MQLKIMGSVIENFRNAKKQIQQPVAISLVLPEMTYNATFSLVRPALSNDTLTIRRYPAVDPARVEARIKAYCEANKEEIEQMLAEQGEDTFQWD